MSSQEPALPEEILEKIFLRLPPDEPACLTCASLASKLWISHLSGNRLCGLYYEFHRSPPPMLGFMYHLPLNSNAAGEDLIPLFVPTTQFSPLTPKNWGHIKYYTWGCRHGRVLLVDDNNDPRKLVIWDPITGNQREFPTPAIEFDSYGVAVLRAVTGCDHYACHEGPFKVIFFGMTKGIDGGSVACVHVHFQETGEWNEECSGIDLGIEDEFVEAMPSVLIEDTLYQMISDDYDYHHIEILPYNMASDCLSQIDAPHGRTFVNDILIAMEDGSLGYVQSSGLNLHMWPRQMGFDGVAVWTRHKILQHRYPINGYKLIGYVERSEIIS